MVTINHSFDLSGSGYNINSERLNHFNYSELSTLEIE